MTPFKTRIAPTPSGYLHAGNAFSFVLTALWARLNNAVIHLRIDDLDRQRYRKKYVEDIFRTLEFLGIEWEEGPHTPDEFEKEFSQRHRMELYSKALDDLWDTGRVYACTCSRREISEISGEGVYPGTCREKDLGKFLVGAAWRLKTDPHKVSLAGFSGERSLHPLNPSMHDFIVRRKDGIPAYQIASVADDLYFGITHIVRGEDLYDSTIAQLFLAERSGLKNFRQARFLHHPLIPDPRGGKLSKSQDSAALVKNSLSRREIYSRVAQYLGVSEAVGSFDDLIRVCREGERNISGNKVRE